MLFTAENFSTLFLPIDVVFDGMGVSAAFVRDFMEEHAEALQGLTTEEVNNKVVKLLTKDAKCSLLQLLRSKPNIRRTLGKAIVFVSHAWKYSFKDVVAVMLDYADRHAGTYFWFDLFCNNQHEAPDYPFEWWSTTFKQNIVGIGKVLLVMTPWRDPVLLTRAW